MLLAVIGFLVVLGPLIFLHELGHYAVGRLFGVHAETFSIGMGREVAGWNDRRGTRWKLSALPLGGYVKFAGDMGPGGRTDPAWLALPAEERARTFQARPLWQRFLIVAAGPATNFLVAILIFAGFFLSFGIFETSTTIARVLPGSAAARAGIVPGDAVSRIDGRAFERFDDVARYVMLRPGQPMKVELLRDGGSRTVEVTPATAVDRDPLGEAQKRGLLGIVPDRPTIVAAGPVRALAEGVRATGSAIRLTADVLGQVVTGNRSAKELGGPVKIARFSGETISAGLLPIVYFMAIISINLGFMNLLPIPMLDGGHLMFYLMEGAAGRPLPARAQEWAFRSGLALLATFFVFVTANDLGSLGLWRKLAGLIG